MTEVNINDERSVRIGKMQELQEMGIAPYPAQSTKTDSILAALEKPEGAVVRIAGRIMTKREMGKLTFCHIQDEYGRVQIVLQQDEVGTEVYKLFTKKIDSADIIEVEGKRFVTHKGEQSILVTSWKLLTKALRPLPDKFHGLQDEEIRLRKRYLEFISNPEAKELFYKKSRFWQATREFLCKEGFLEVETPVLESTPGGADATPFITHHDALDIDVFLRISMGELWQKRLMVAGFEKTFEIGRQFRNEGMSREHLQDYTQMEFYWGYADYTMSMDLVERMYKYIIKEAFGTLTFDIGEFTGIDIGSTWEKIDYTDTIKQAHGVDISSATDDEIREKLKELHIDIEEFAGRGRMIDVLWKQVRRTIKGPVLLINHPVAVSPLAKRLTTNKELTERYQVIIAGSEIGNGYSELNDPIDQAARFEEQARLREEGDAEAQMHDKDFVEALEHGMPPTSGFGFSERLFSFLANKPIRECVLFPLMRPEDHTPADKKKTAKTLVAHAVLLDLPDIPQWSKLNAAAHLAASLAAREGKRLFEIEETKTTDGERVPMNIRHAIMMKKTDSREQLIQLKKEAEAQGLEVSCFTEEMRDSRNDKEVKEKQEKKALQDIQFLGVLVFGDMKKVEKLTGQFEFAD